MSALARLRSAALGGAITVAAVAAFTFPAVAALVEGTSWWVPATASLLAMSAVGALSRATLGLSWPALLPQLLVLVGAFCLPALPSESRWGPFPAPGSGQAVREAFLGIGSVVRDDIAPVRAVPEAVGAVCLLVALLALVADWLINAAPRSPALAAVTLGVVPLAVSFVLDGPLGVWALLLAGAAVVLVLLAPRGTSAGAGRRKRRTGSPSAPGTPSTPSTAASPARQHRGIRPEARWAWSGAAAVTALSLAGAAAAPGILLPNPNEGAMPVGSRIITPGTSTGVNPVLDLSRDLRTPINRSVIRYTTTSTEPVYLRTSVIDDLLSSSWGPTTGDIRVYSPGTEFFRTDRERDARAVADRLVPFELPSAAAMAGTGYSPDWLTSGWVDGYLDEGSWPPQTDEAERKQAPRVGVDAFGYTSPWLPLPDGTVTTGPLPSTYHLVDKTGTLVQSEEKAIEGGSYWATPVVPATADALADSLPLSAVAQQANEVGLEPQQDPDPAGSDADRERIPASIRDAARRVVEEAGAGDRPDLRAEALRRHLTSSQYRYSERAPITSGSDTGGLAMVERFLQDRSGYCVHFASAMVLMARAEGIPARLALGYAPGTATGKAATIAGVEGREFMVNSRNAHAWAQLYFVGVGWVDVDPTPGRAPVDSLLESPETTPAPRTTPSNQGADNPETAPPTTRSTPTSTGASDPTSGTASAGAGPADGTGSGPGAALAWLLAGGGAAAVGALGWAFLARRRRATEQLIASGAPGAGAAAWKALSAAASRRLSPRQPGLPAPEQAAAWFPSGEAAQAAAHIAAAADADRFSPAGTAKHDGAALGESLRLVLEALGRRRGH